MAKPLQRVWTYGGVGYMEILSPKHGRHVTKFDSARLPEVITSRWQVHVDTGGICYAQRRGGVSMQCHLFPSASKGFVRDHINHDGLDNRSANIRLVPSSHNNLNRVTRKYPMGVGRVNQGPKPFNARLSLGVFATAEEAHDAWKIAYKKLNGTLPECAA